MFFSAKYSNYSDAPPTSINGEINFMLSNCFLGRMLAKYLSSISRDKTNSSNHGNSSPRNNLISIFTHLKLCLATATHNLKWVKIIMFD